MNETIEKIAFIYNINTFVILLVENKTKTAKFSSSQSSLGRVFFCMKQAFCSFFLTTQWQPSQSQSHSCWVLQAKCALGSLKLLFSACFEGVLVFSFLKNPSRTRRTLLL